MNALVQTEVSSLPAPISPALDKKLSYHASKLVAVGLGFEVMATDTPSKEDRDAMERRLSSLAHWMMPTDKLWLFDQITALIGTMPRQNAGGPEDTAVLIRIYGSTLKELPRFALDKMFRAAHTGKIGNPPWLPTVAELHRYAEGQCTALHIEQRKLQNVLTAKINFVRPDAERRKQLADYARQVAADIREKARTQLARGRMSSDDITAAQAEALLHAQAIHERVMSNTPDPRPMPPASPALIKALANKGIHLESKHEAAA